MLLVPIVSKLAPMLREQLPDLIAGWWLQIAPPSVKLGLPVPVSLAEVKTELMELLQSHGAELGRHGVAVAGHRGGQPGQPRGAWAC